MTDEQATQTQAEARERYNPHVIEERWRTRWEETGFYRTDLTLASGRPKFYNLMEFPYPSAEGLHIGHVYTYGGADTNGRFQRMRGYEVFEPMGFDAFGIHSENYALKININPMQLTARTTRRYREEQLGRIGAMFDWSHSVDTSQPSYYRWTQWIFLQLYKAGLAVRKEAAVNWCPKDLTVLANEQVIDGRCERCGTPVVQRELTQWFFTITDYADRLLANLEKLDWPDESKVRQANWIGRSRATAEAGAMGRLVDAARQSRGDDKAGLAEIVCQLGCEFKAAPDALREPTIAIIGRIPEQRAAHAEQRRRPSQVRRAGVDSQSRLARPG